MTSRLLLIQLTEAVYVKSGKLQISRQIRQVTENTYSKVTAKVQLGGKRSSDFNINRGIVQYLVIDKGENT